MSAAATISATPTPGADDPTIVVLEELCRAAMNGMSYELWTFHSTAAMRRAMQPALKTVARARGRSCFGFDWQHALDD